MNFDIPTESLKDRSEERKNLIYVAIIFVKNKVNFSVPNVTLEKT